MNATIGTQVIFRNYNNISYEGIIINESEKAVLLQFGALLGSNHERNHKTWLPKSVLEIKKFDSCDAEYFSIKSWFIKNIFKAK